MTDKLLKLDKIFLKDTPEISEQMIQDMIADNPTMLGLGDVRLLDRERVQSSGGRLDLLLQDDDNGFRYEVEIQLGETDPSHIIRCIEYWDIERKRYPQYDHCAVIIAEDITSRFFNVIGLFNSAIPLIAIQMSAVKVDDKIGLSFITVLDDMAYGLDDEEEERISATREYWEERGSPLTIGMMDELFKIVQEIEPNAIPNYNKNYVSTVVNGKSVNFVAFVPRKKTLNFRMYMKYSEGMIRWLEDSGLSMLAYNKHFNRYGISLSEGDIEKHRDLLKKLIQKAYAKRFGS